MKNLIAICIACCATVITAFPMYQPQPMPFIKGFGGIPCPTHGMHGGFGGEQFRFGGGRVGIGGGHAGIGGGQIGFGGRQVGFGGRQAGFGGDFLEQYDNFNDNAGIVTSVGQRGIRGQLDDHSGIFNNRFNDDHFNNDHFNNDRFGNDDSGFFGNDDGGRIAFTRPAQRGAFPSTSIDGGALRTLPGQGTVFSSGGIRQGGIHRDNFNNGFDNFDINNDLRGVHALISHKK